MNLIDLLTAMSGHEPTQVITTVLLPGGTDAHWTATVMPDSRILMQDCSLNIGIMGTRDQLTTMLSRMRVALDHPITEDQRGEAANVG